MGCRGFQTQPSLQSFGVCDETNERVLCHNGLISILKFYNYHMNVFCFLEFAKFCQFNHLVMRDCLFCLILIVYFTQFVPKFICWMRIYFSNFILCLKENEKKVIIILNKDKKREKSKFII